MNTFVEDFYPEWARSVALRPEVSNRDRKIMLELADLCESSVPLETSDVNNILRTLRFYRDLPSTMSEECSQLLTDPKAKTRFRRYSRLRVLDLGEDEQGAKYVKITMPEAFWSTVFRKRFEDKQRCKGVWSKDLSCRVYDFYELNLLELYNFVVQHDFIVSDAYLECVEEMQRLYRTISDYTPGSRVVNGNVELVNAPSSAVEYFDQHKTGNYKKDIFLAKCMGYPTFEFSSASSVEIIASSLATSFWIRELDKFFEIFKDLELPVCLVVDRRIDVVKWAEAFYTAAARHGVDQTSIIDYTSKSVGADITNVELKPATITLFDATPIVLLRQNLGSCVIIATTEIIPSTDLRIPWALKTYPAVLYLTEFSPIVHSKGSNKIVKV